MESGTTWAGVAAENAKKRKELGLKDTQTITISLICSLIVLIESIECELDKGIDTDTLLSFCVAYFLLLFF